MELFSLKRICLDSVSNHLSMWCESAKTEDFFKYMYVIGPFNDVAPDLTQQVIDLAYKKQLLKICYFPLLIHENFTKLDISKCRSIVTDQVLKLISSRCQRLTSLNLNGCTRLSSSVLNETLPTLVNLQSIQLSKCRGATNNLLCKLRENCFKLEELVLDLCPKITNIGMEKLLMVAKKNVCLNLLHLSVSSTSITTKSLSIILSKLPKLRRLGFSDIAKDESLIFDHFPDYPNLVELNIFATYLENSDLSLMLDRLPNLVKFKSNMTDNVGRILKNSLIHLGNIISLDLSGSTLRFDDFVVFLKRRGGQLMYLNLSEIRSVSLFLLCLFCRSLKELILEHCENVDPSLPSNDSLALDYRDNLTKSGGDYLLSHFCPELSHINFNFMTIDENIAVEMLKHIACAIFCNHSQLITLSLKKIQHELIDDEVLEQISASSTNACLRTLDLSCCDGVSADMLWMIVENYHLLRFLDVSHCKLIDIATVSQLRKELKRSNRPLQVIWA